MITVPATFGIHTKKSTPVVPVGNNGKFTYTLSAPAKTSAGVYTVGGTMVRTLWALQDKTAGTHQGEWDGTDDWGNPISSPDANYVINVTTSNTTYNWDGTVGNSSRVMTEEHKHHGYYRCAKGITITNNFCYFGNGYPEGGPSVAKFALADPNYRLNLWGPNVNTGDVGYLCSDNSLVYWAGYDPNKPPTTTFLLATVVGTDAEYTFPAGSIYDSTWGRDFPSTIAQMTAPGSEIIGIAVQKTGAYLFVARPGLNQLQVFNKTSGALVQTLVYPNVRLICTSPVDSSLWMVTGTSSITKHTINADGTLSTLTASVLGADQPCALQVNPSGTQIAVAQAGSTHQLKFYSTSTGALINTLGVLGGYSADPLVSNTKFYFNDIRVSQFRYPLSTIAFLPDGSFWLGDPGNYRLLKFSAALAYQDTIQYLGSSYRTYVDRRNSTRLFSDYLEFQVDYTQALTGTTGWTLYKNWGFGIPRAADTEFVGTKYEYGFLNPTTFPNGRTYGFLRTTPNNFVRLIEFPSTGMLRISDIYRNNIGSKITTSDLSVQNFIKGYRAHEANPGDPLITVLRTYPHTGYDVNGWPTWSTTANTTTTFPPLTMENPNDFPGDEMITSSNKVIMYASDTYGRDNTTDLQWGYHLGGLALNGNGLPFQWRTQRANHQRYRGPYPGTERFEVGNIVNSYSGSQHTLAGRNIFTGYHGEFWKNLQTNYYGHYWDNGLPVGFFGTDREKVGGISKHAQPEMAGNALTPIAVFHPTDVTKAFLYHGDEADHSGIHRWSIAGLNTITELTQTIPFPSAYVAPVKNYIDIMEGIPFDSDMPHGTAGWNRSPNPFPATSDFSIRSNYHVYDERSPRDLRFNWTDTVKTPGTGLNMGYFVNKALGSNTVSGSWELEGKIAFGGGDGGNTNIAVFAEVLDAAGKVIISIWAKQQYNDPVYGVANKIIGNNVTLDEGENTAFRDKMRYGKDIKVVINNGIITMKYADSTTKTVPIADPTANWRTPTTFRMRFIRDPALGAGAGKNMIIQDFRIFKDRI